MLLGGCAAPAWPGCGGPPGDSVAYVIDHGWHTDLGVPASELSGGLAVFRRIFPGARAFVFGFGKRTFFTARVNSLSEYVLGPFPGPGAILVTGLRVAPDQAFPGDPVVLLHLPPGGAKRLSDFLWAALAKGPGGLPRQIATGPYPGSLFYDATETYALAYTCNAWTLDALGHAGAPVNPAGVVFAGQAMRRARRAAMCALPGRGSAAGVPSASAPPLSH